MSAVGEENSSLASKCMDFCQALAKKGKTFNFSLSIGSGFSFSLDTRSEDIRPSESRSQVPQPSAEMPSGDGNSWKRNETLRQ